MKTNEHLHFGHSERPVITIVGAGSLNWGRRIVVDILRNPDLNTCAIRLVDVDPDRLNLVLEWCEIARVVLGLEGVSITAHTDLRAGLAGATACLTAISVGGDRLWRYDVMHPQLDGVFQAVGDTTGPGGAVRALRHAPALRKIAQTLADVGAPNAVLIQLTNPLNALTASIDNVPGIRVIGFCHGFIDTEYLFASALGLIDTDQSQMMDWRASAPLIRTELAGNNHFVFIDKLQIGERIYNQSDIGELVPQICDVPFREAVWSRFGALVGNYARHPAEFLSGFLNSRSGFGALWGIPAMADEINPIHGERHDKSRACLEREIADAKQRLDAAQKWDLRHSQEPLAELIAAFHTGAEFRTHLNLRNSGAIAGVPDDAHMEMSCRIVGGTIHRPSVTFSDRLTAELCRVARCQLHLAQCCISFDDELLIEALKEDALMVLDSVAVRRMMNEMVAFQHEWIFSNGS